MANKKNFTNIIREEKKNFDNSKMHAAYHLKIASEIIDNKNFTEVIDNTVKLLEKQ